MIAGEFAPKQVVVLRVPEGEQLWLISESCMHATLFATNDAFSKAAVEFVTKNPDWTYEPNQTAIVGEVNAEDGCIFVSVDRDGPQGWLHVSLAKLTSEERQKVANAAARRAEARPSILHGASAAKTDDPVVYITRTGQKFHSSSCRSLHRSKELYKVRRSEALRQGYSACKLC
jgi:hypothetical protein